MVWLIPYDVPATLETFATESIDLASLVTRIERHRINQEAIQRRDAVSRVETATEPPENIAPDIFDEIPKSDSTYLGLSTSLIPHARIPNLVLLQYQTFDGAMAYQPCSRDIDLSHLFDALEPIDRNGDYNFKLARAWSCIIQAMPDLPKEVRWVLATVYDFSNQMLRSGKSEQTLWAMRPWLMHWFDVADKLFEINHIFASAPSVDWFLRPTEVTTSEHVDQVRSGISSASTWTEEDETRIQHAPLSPSDLDVPNFSRGVHYSSAVAIKAWLNQQQHAIEVEGSAIFDSTPGGYASPKARGSLSPDTPLIVDGASNLSNSKKSGPSKQPRPVMNSSRSRMPSPRDSGIGSDCHSCPISAGSIDLIT